jgi:hypothetical protein
MGATTEARDSQQSWRQRFLMSDISGWLFLRLSDRVIEVTEAQQEATEAGGETEARSC